MEFENRKVKTGTLYRNTKISTGDINEEARTVSLSFSSEAPIERYFGTEILDHDKKSVDLKRLNDGGALLVDHDTRQQVGVIEISEVGKDRVGRALVRFGKSQRAEEEFQDVLGGIRTKVSVGYRINRMVQEESDPENPIFRATNWEPMEISLVSVPADVSVGVGRTDDHAGHETETLYLKKEQKKMPEEKTIEKTIETPPAVDEGKVREEARQKETARVNEILVIGEKFQMQDEARNAISGNVSINQFRQKVLDKMGEPEAKPQTGTLDMEKKDLEKYSIVNAIRAMAKGDWSIAPLEREASNAITGQLGKDPQGFYVPRDLQGWGVRDLTVGTDAAGGYLKGTDHLGDSYIDALRAALVIKRLGAKVLTGLVGDLAIPAANAVTTVYWVAESGEPTEGAPTFRQIAMAPKTVASYVDMSRKLLKQSSPDIESLVRADLMAGTAVGIDAVAIEGAGSNEPTGILQTSGIGAVALGTNGAAPTWASVVNLIREVSVDNALLGNLGYLTNPLVVAKLRTTVKVASTDSVMIMGEGNTLLGYPVEQTTNVPSDLTKGSGTSLSAMIFGNFADVIVGEWGALDVLVDPYSLSTQGATRVTTFMDVDVAVRHAESFAAIQDMITT